MRRTLATVFGVFASAFVTSLVLVGWLLSSSITNENAAITLGAIATLGPTALAILFLRRLYPSPPPPAEPPPPFDGELVVESDDDGNYTIIGTEVALHALIQSCRRAIERGGETGDRVGEIREIVLQQELPLEPEPPVRGVRLVAQQVVGCLFLLFVVVTWLRGCVAIERDIDGWFR